MQRLGYGDTVGGKEYFPAKGKIVTYAAAVSLLAILSLTAAATFGKRQDTRLVRETIWLRHMAPSSFVKALVHWAPPEPMAAKFPAPIISDGIEQIAPNDTAGTVTITARSPEDLARIRTAANLLGGSALHLRLDVRILKKTPTPDSALPVAIGSCDTDSSAPVSLALYGAKRLFILNMTPMLDASRKVSVNMNAVVEYRANPNSFSTDCETTGSPVESGKPMVEATVSTKADGAPEEHYQIEVTPTILGQRE